MHSALETLIPTIRRETLLASDWPSCSCSSRFRCRRSSSGPGRLGDYDSFAANPFLVVGGPTNRASISGSQGFPLIARLSSSAQRFVNRRHRLKHDMAVPSTLNLVGRNEGMA